MSDNINNLAVVGELISKTIILSVQESYLSSLVAYTKKLAQHIDKDMEFMVEIWEKVAPELTNEFKTIIAKDTKKKEREQNRLKKAEEQANKPKCQYQSIRKKTICGSSSHVETFEGVDYCKKHRIQIQNRHTCEYTPQRSANKTVCGRNIRKDQEIWSGEGPYKNMWLCASHRKSAETAAKKLEKKIENQCIAVWSDKCRDPSKHNQQCTNTAVENGFCSRHRKKVTEEKKDKEKRESIKEAKKNLEASMIEKLKKEKEELKDEKPQKSGQIKEKSTNQPGRRNKNESKNESKKIQITRLEESDLSELVATKFKDKIKWVPVKVLRENGEILDCVVNDISGLCCYRIDTQKPITPENLILAGVIEDCSIKEGEIINSIQLPNDFEFELASELKINTNSEPPALELEEMTEEVSQ